MVYPRACGGTSPRPSRLLSGPGLSPRVRGNPTLRRAGVLSGGSIPARAGGTRDRPGCTDEGPGLSPRVRGNPERLNLVADDPRSIPARAGEPFSILPSSGKPYLELVVRAPGGSYRP